MKRLVFLSLMTALVALAGCKKENANVVQSILFTNVENGKLTMIAGESFRVKYTVEPAALRETAVLEWSSSKEDVASVRNGRISANEEGKATITATCGNATATIAVEVESVDVTAFDIDPTIIRKSVNVEVPVVGDCRLGSGVFKGRRIRVNPVAFPVLISCSAFLHRVPQGCRLCGCFRNGDRIAP